MFPCYTIGKVCCILLSGRNTNKHMVIYMDWVEWIYILLDFNIHVYYTKRGDGVGMTTVRVQYEANTRFITNYFLM